MNKTTLVESMIKLIEHMGEKTTAVEEIFEDFEEDDVNRLLSDLEDSDLHLRKVSAMFLCTILHQSRTNQEKFCEILNTGFLAGRICVNSIPSCFSPHLRKHKNLIQAISQSPFNHPAFLNSQEPSPSSATSINHKAREQQQPQQQQPEQQQQIPICWYVTPEQLEENDLRPKLFYKSQQKLSTEERLNEFVDPLFTLIGFTAIEQSPNQSQQCQFKNNTFLIFIQYYPSPDSSNEQISIEINDEKNPSFLSQAIPINQSASSHNSRSTQNESLLPKQHKQRQQPQYHSQTSKNSPQASTFKPTTSSNSFVSPQSNDVHSFVEEPPVIYSEKNSSVSSKMDSPHRITSKTLEIQSALPTHVSPTTSQFSTSKQGILPSTLQQQISPKNPSQNESNIRFFCRPTQHQQAKMQLLDQSTAAANASTASSTITTTSSFKLQSPVIAKLVSTPISNKNSTHQSVVPATLSNSLLFAPGDVPAAAAAASTAQSVTTTDQHQIAASNNSKQTKNPSYFQSTAIPQYEIFLSQEQQYQQQQIKQNSLHFPSKLQAQFAGNTTHSFHVDSTKANSSLQINDQQSLQQYSSTPNQNTNSKQNAASNLYNNNNNNEVDFIESNRRRQSQQNQQQQQQQQQQMQQLKQQQQLSNRTKEAANSHNNSTIKANSYFVFQENSQRSAMKKLSMQSLTPMNSARKSTVIPPQQMIKSTGLLPQNILSPLSNSIDQLNQLSISSSNLENSVSTIYRMNTHATGSINNSQHESTTTTTMTTNTATSQLKYQQLLPRTSTSIKTSQVEQTSQSRMQSSYQDQKRPPPINFPEDMKGIPFQESPRLSRSIQLKKSQFSSELPLQQQLQQQSQQQHQLKQQQQQQQNQLQQQSQHIQQFQVKQLTPNSHQVTAALWNSLDSPTVSQMASTAGTAAHFFSKDRPQKFRNNISNTSIHSKNNNNNSSNISNTVNNNDNNNLANSSISSSMILSHQHTNMHETSKNGKNEKANYNHSNNTSNPHPSKPNGSLSLSRTTQPLYPETKKQIKLHGSSVSQIKSDESGSSHRITSNKLTVSPINHLVNRGHVSLSGTTSSSSNNNNNNSSNPRNNFGSTTTSSNLHPSNKRSSLITSDESLSPLSYGNIPSSPSIEQKYLTSFSLMFVKPSTSKSMKHSSPEIEARFEQNKNKNEIAFKKHPRIKPIETVASISVDYQIKQQLSTKSRSSACQDAATVGENRSILPSDNSIHLINNNKSNNFHNNSATIGNGRNQPHVSPTPILQTKPNRNLLSMTISTSSPINNCINYYNNNRKGSEEQLQQSSQVKSSQLNSPSDSISNPLSLTSFKSARTTMNAAIDSKGIIVLPKKK